MSVDLFVGLVDVHMGDAVPGQLGARPVLAAVNVALRETGAGEYREAEDLGEWRFRSQFSSSHLKAVKQAAAFLEVEGELPAAEEEWYERVAILGEFYLLDTSKGGEPFYNLDRPDCSRAVKWFPNLLLHGTQGCYVPVRFDGLVRARAELEIEGDGIIGSSYGLLAECERLSEALGVPIGADVREVNAMGWEFSKKLAAIGCVELIRACRASIEKWAAVVLG